MGRPSGPMLSARFAAIGHKGVGAEAPPTKAAALPQRPGGCGRAFRPDAVVADHGDLIGKHRG
ncbi:DUF6053 domain-containing protein [Lysobacter enzymogenes]|uniref:DUF6053 domain-containing protein n=1 Tax=Lysobacter enzymogenes TaxID=69 RepID=UPI003D18E9DD